MSQQPDPQQRTGATFFFPSDSEASDSSNGSQPNSGVHPAPIPPRLIQRPPHTAAPPHYAGTQTGAGAVYPPAIPARPFEFVANPPTRRGAPMAARGGASLSPANAQAGGLGRGSGQAARPPRPAGGWQAAAPAAHLAGGSGQPRPSNFPGALDHASSPGVPTAALSQHPAARGGAARGGAGGPAHGRPMQARRVTVPRAESNELCRYCGVYMPASQLPTHMMHQHPYLYGNSGY